jgi:hypothetical protein
METFRQKNGGQFAAIFSALSFIALLILTLVESKAASTLTAAVSTASPISVPIVSVASPN